MGANGSGKSTLLRIAAGRDTPSTGRVVYAGRAMAQDDLVVRTEIAVVGDMVSAYPDLTVREHLQLVAVAHGAGRDGDELVDRALRECRLGDHGDALPGSLSSGQLQALHLATMLVRPRRLMVLDEPEQRLDPAARRWLAGLLVAQKQAGRGPADGHPPRRAGHRGRRPRPGAQRRRGHRARRRRTPALTAIR